jgi:hypothetical protein
MFLDICYNMGTEIISIFIEICSLHFLYLKKDISSMNIYIAVIIIYIFIQVLIFGNWMIY